MKPGRREILLASWEIRVRCQAGLRKLRRQVAALQREVIVESPRGPGPAPGGA